MRSGKARTRPLYVRSAPFKFEDIGGPVYLEWNYEDPDAPVAIYTHKPRDFAEGPVEGFPLASFEDALENATLNPVIAGNAIDGRVISRGTKYELSIKDGHASVAPTTSAAVSEGEFPPGLAAAMARAITGAVEAPVYGLELSGLTDPDPSEARGHSARGASLARGSRSLAELRDGRGDSDGPLVVRNLEFWREELARLVKAGGTFVTESLLTGILSRDAIDIRFPTMDVDVLVVESDDWNVDINNEELEFSTGALIKTEDEHV